MNDRQLQLVLQDIAEQAQNITRLAALHTQSDPEIADAMVLAMETAAQRVGLLASMALVRMPGGDALDAGPVGFDVERWMMPPAYFGSDGA